MLKLGRYPPKNYSRATLKQTTLKKKIKNKNGGSHMQAMTATLFRHLNEQGYKFSMITTGISKHVRCPLEEKGVGLLSFFLFKKTCDGLVLSTSVANETKI